MQDKKQQLESDMEQLTGSKLGKDYVNVVYCHTAYLTSMLERIFIDYYWLFHYVQEPFSDLYDMQMIPL